METKEKYISEEDIKRLKAVENFRSLTSLSPEELDKLSTVEEKYQEACREIESDDIGMITEGLIELGCLNGYRDSSERIKEAAIKLRKLSQAQRKESKTDEIEYQEALRQLKGNDIITIAKGIATIIRIKLDSEIASSVIEGLNRIVKMADSQVVKTKETQQQKATVTGEKKEQKTVKSTFNTEESVSTVSKTLISNPNADSESYVSKSDGTVYKKGDIIEFGNYPQARMVLGIFSKQPIKWRVLKTEDNRMLVISEMGIDCKNYHGKREDVTWADCDLRKWLNSEFKEKAFSNEEIRKVQMFTNENKDNSEYGTKGGKATDDQVFLLSLEEAEKYFKDDDSRRCKATEYAVKQGAYVNTNTGSKANGFSWWWLRSPGDNSLDAADVLPGGSLYALGYSVYRDFGVVRPALWLTI